LMSTAMDAPSDERIGFQPGPHPRQVLILAIQTACER